jgi:REP element-mobilizing transposase RayT
VPLILGLFCHMTWLMKNKTQFKDKSEFGGKLLNVSNARTARPVSTKQAMHLVLRSSLARGKHSMSNKGVALAIDETIKSQAENCGVRILQYSNQGHHLHLLVMVKGRAQLTSFLKSVSGLVARIVIGAQRGAPKKVKFWDQRPWSKVLTDGENLKKYAQQNFNENVGFSSKKMVAKR